MKPDIPRAGIPIVVKLLCEFLARKGTAVYGQGLHQIDGGMSPIKLFAKPIASCAAQRIERFGNINRPWRRR
jgi:hypothetical protein